MRRLATILVVLTAGVAAAQQQAAPSAAPPPATEPDVAIVTNVRASEVRFAEVPEVRVSVYGDVNGQPAVTVSRTDRDNLPSEVQPHVTYRDAGIRLTITSTLPDIERILDEALGVASTSAPASTPKPQARKRSTPRKSSKR